MLHACTIGQVTKECIVGELGRTCCTPERGSTQHTGPKHAAEHAKMVQPVFMDTETSLIYTMPEQLRTPFLSISVSISCQNHPKPVKKTRRNLRSLSFSHQSSAVSSLRPNTKPPTMTEFLRSPVSPRLCGYSLRRTVARDAPGLDQAECSNKSPGSLSLVVRLRESGMKKVVETRRGPVPLTIGSGSE